MNKREVLLNTVLKECEKHLERLNSAYNKMSSFMPLTTEKYQNLSETEIEHTDQFLYRFSKLQDAIGERLFKYTLNYLGEQIQGKSFIDLFNKLEQLEIVEDFDRWMQLREIRNEVAHEYQDEPELNANRLNRIFSLKDDLENYYTNLNAYIQDIQNKSNN